MLFLPIFFMYIFPLFFLGLPVVRTTPIVATIMLLIGIVLWLVQSLQILGFITHPKKLLRKHQKVQTNGKLVQAEIIGHQESHDLEEYPTTSLVVVFPNLAGNQIKTNINLIDSKPHERRYETGKHIDLKLNQNGFNPAFTIEAARFETRFRPWPWFWLIFNIIYGIAFFLISYYFLNDGYGWRFLTPFTPWFWAPVIGIFISRLLRATFNADTAIQTDYQLGTLKSREDFGKLLLYGKTTRGEIVDFSQTGTYINEQPQIRFKIRFNNDSGGVERKHFKQVIPLTEMHTLKKGEIEIVYLPQNTDTFIIGFLDEDR